MANFTNDSKNIDGRWQHDLFEAHERMFEAKLQMKRDRSAQINQSARIVIYNLDGNVTERDLLDLFGDIGELEAISIDRDRLGRSLGRATVTFQRQGDAIKAIEQYNGRMLDSKID